MAETALAQTTEPSIMRRDALGNVQRMLLSEFKLANCPDGTTDGTALYFMLACRSVGAIPEIQDMQLATMRGKPTIVVREQMYLKNLKRKYPDAVLRDGIIGPDGKPKAMNAKAEAEDIGWCEILEKPGGAALGRFEGVRREWEQSGSDAWKKQPNHMLLVRVRCHCAKRIVPLDLPPPPPGSEVPEVMDELEAPLDVTERAKVTVLDEGAGAPEDPPEEAKAPAEGDDVTSTPNEAAATSGGVQKPAEGEAEEPAPWPADVPKPLAEMTAEELTVALGKELKRATAEDLKAGNAWLRKLYGAGVGTIIHMVKKKRADAEGALDKLRPMKDGALRGYDGGQLPMTGGEG